VVNGILISRHLSPASERFVSLSKFKKGLILLTLLRQSAHHPFNPIAINHSLGVSRDVTATKRRNTLDRAEQAAAEPFRHQEPEATRAALYRLGYHPARPCHRCAAERARGMEDSLFPTWPPALAVAARAASFTARTHESRLVGNGNDGLCMYPRAGAVSLDRDCF
jgi:hypothetical protein